MTDERLCQWISSASNHACRNRKKETKKEVKKDAGESSDAPKKRQSGYLLFGKEMRADIKAAMEADLEEGEKLKPQAVVTHLAGLWKALSDEEKAEWNEKAKPKEESEEEE